VKAEGESAPESLDAWHQHKGGEWRDLPGCRVVDSYGDVASEVLTLREGCGLIERRWVEAFLVSGEDRQRFLNGYVTCDVAPLEVGEGTYGFFTTSQGRILSDAVIFVGSEALRVEVPTGRAESLIEHLSRFIIADRVELAPAGAQARWALLGTGADELVRNLAPSITESFWSSIETEVGGRRIELWRDRSLGVEAYGVVAVGDEAASVAESLVAEGAVPVGFAAVETLRVEAGVPRYGADFDEANFPQETGFEDAISYTKGCYLGQEIVARIHYRGGVNHHLRSLLVEGSEVPETGGSVLYEDKQVGRLGSASFSAVLGHTIGLTILHRKAAESGTRVVLEGGVVARVEEPAFLAATIATPVV
jgi:folate-binding protein YgfZ